ncbi:MAG: anti-sigma factor family protein [Candidatus Geothermincolia bacterium]
MRCRRACRLLSSFREGSLRPQLYSRLAAHLESCEECRGKLASLDRLAATLEGLPSVEMSEAASSSLHQALRREMDGQPRRSWRLSYRIATAFVSVLALVALSTVAFSLLWRPEESTQMSGRGPESPASTSDVTAEHLAGLDQDAASRGLSAPQPLVMTGDKALAEPDLATYAPDYGQRFSFYAYYWEAGGAGENEPLAELQAEYVARMGQAAAALGEDPASLAASLWLSMQTAGSERLLPCYAEKVLYAGKPAWLISLSGPGDAAFFAEQPKAAEQEAAPKMMYVVDAALFEILY